MPTRSYTSTCIAETVGLQVFTAKGHYVNSIDSERPCTILLVLIELTDHYQYWLQVVGGIIGAMLDNRYIIMIHNK